MFDDKSIKLSDNPTEQELKQAVASLFEEHWLTGYDYKKANLINYQSAPFPVNLISNPKYIINTLYLMTMSESVSRYHNNMLDDKAWKETLHWDLKGGLCIFFSTLFYSLLVEDKVYTKDEIQLVQGYYSFKLREDFPSILPFGNNQYGLHSWVLLNEEVVIDFSSNQNELFFDFKEKPPYILGEIPEGMNLVGFPETRKTVNKYVRMFAKEQGMKPQEWIDYHKEQALQVAHKINQDRQG